jgi:DNA invertase Pin-like site-specific DNA recombinase
MVMVYKLDRLGRSLQHLLWVISELGRLGVSVVATSQGIDTSHDSPIAKVQLAVLGAVAEFERDLIRERIKLGRDRAVRRGIKLGRPPKLGGLAESVRAMKAKGKSFAKIAAALKISKQSAWRISKGEKT